MHIQVFHHALLRSAVAGALLLAGAACSGSDGIESAARREATANLAELERIRPPEDSTETRGTGTTSETADEEPIEASE